MKDPASVLSSVHQRSNGFVQNTGTCSCVEGSDKQLIEVHSVLSLCKWKLCQLIYFAMVRIFSFSFT